MSRAPRLLISGYYGFGNAGDEAVLAGLADIFRETMPEATLCVASAAPEATRRVHGVDAFPRGSMTEFRARMRDCDCFVSGGGSLFQDVTSRRSIYYYLGTLALAQMQRRPVMICGQGIGPIQAAPARLASAALFNRAALITVRDADSLETLRQLGVTQPRAVLTADPVFALRPAPAGSAARILRDAGAAGDAPRVAFALRRWPPQAAATALVEAAAEAVAFVHREMGAQAVFAPLYPSEDRAFAEEIAARAGTPAVVLPGGYSPREYLALFGQMDLVVGMRLHALIFAAVQGVPLVGISYDPKVDGFLRAVDRTPAADLSSINGEVLIHALRNVWKTRAEEASFLKQKAVKLREKALENGTLLAPLMQI